MLAFFLFSLQWLMFSFLFFYLEQTFFYSRVLKWLKNGLEQWRYSRESRKLPSEMTQFLETIKSYLQAGAVLQRALELSYSHKSWCYPIRYALSTVLSRYQKGQHLVQALSLAIDDCRQQLRGLDFLYIHSILISLRIGFASGGNIIVVMDTLKEKITNKISLERKIRVTTAQMRLQAYVIGAAPLVIGILVWLVTPQYILFFFQNPLGLLLLTVMVALNMCGFLFLRMILKIE